jgi:hypothetical protein
MASVGSPQIAASIGDFKAVGHQRPNRIARYNAMEKTVNQIAQWKFLI